MSFDGECLPPFEGAMNFRQPCLGYEKQDPVLYGKKWQALESRLLDVIGCSEPITISARQSQLSAAADRHRALAHALRSLRLRPVSITARFSSATAVECMNFG
jgi:hypothetical protein